MKEKGILKNKTNSLWDWLKQINYIKSEPNSFTQEDWDKNFNSYSIHRILSMNLDYIEIVNHVQKILPQNKKEIYTIYREFIPINNKWNKYIKSNTKKRNKDLIKYFTDLWEISSKEADEYLELIHKDEIKGYLMGFGLEKKEITQLMK